MKVLIFGFGNRVKNSILPAIESTFKNTYLKIDIVNATGLSQINNKNINSLISFKNFSNHNQISYDFIIICVPKNQQYLIFKKLNKNIRSKILIDTPVLKGILKYEKYYDISVLEDIVFMPWIQLLKKEINELTNIEIFCFYSCHEYHGIAFLETLIDSKIIYSSRTIIDNNEFNLKIKFENGVSVFIVSPSNYKIGFILIKSLEKNILIGNEATYLQSNLHHNTKDFILFSFNGDKNIIKNLSNYKYQGLLEIIKKILHKDNDIPSIKNSLNQQKIASSNKLKIKCLLFIKKFIILCKINLWKN